MAAPDTLRDAKISLTNGSGAIPALGFGTLIPDPVATKQATKAALEAGFRHFDVRNATAMNRRSAKRCRRCSRRGRFGGRTCSSPRSSGTTTIVPSGSNPLSRRVAGNSNSTTSICYLIHTPFAFQPGDEQDPRDESGQCDLRSGVTLLETWRALESLVDEGRCRAIGLSDVNLEKTAGDLRSRADQAGGRTGRIPSVSPGMGAARLLSTAGDRAAGVRGAGACAASPNCWTIR